MDTVFQGVVVPLLTPINTDESVDYGSLEKLVEHVLAGGVDAIFAMGTTGEFARFDSETRGKIIAAIVGYTKGRVPVYAGVSDCGTKRVLENARLAEQGGASAIVASLPYYFPNTSPGEALSFFQDIAGQSGLPLILYDIPMAVGTPIPLSVIDALLDSQSIAAVKISGNDLTYIREVIAKAKSGEKAISVLIGNESLNFAGLSMGADGMVPSLANPFPKLLAAVYQSAVDDDLAQLRHYCDMVNSFNQLNGYCDSWMSPNIWRKEALEQMGIGSNCFTKPYTPVDSATKSKIANIIIQYQSVFQ